MFIRIYIGSPPITTIVVAEASILVQYWRSWIFLYLLFFLFEWCLTLELSIILVAKELSFATNSDFRTLISYTTSCRRPLIIQTMNYVRTKSRSLKYQRFTPLYCTDIGVRKFEFVAKTHSHLSLKFWNSSYLEKIICPR